MYHLYLLFGEKGAICNWQLGANRAKDPLSLYIIFFIQPSLDYGDIERDTFLKNGLKTRDSRNRAGRVILRTNYRKVSKVATPFTFGFSSVFLSQRSRGFYFQVAEMSNAVRSISLTIIMSNVRACTSTNKNMNIPYLLD